VVETTCPVDGNICLLLVQLHCSSYKMCRLTKLKQTIKHWTVLSNIDCGTKHVVWSDGPQKLNVVIAVVLGHLFATGFVNLCALTHIDLHFPVQSIVEKEVVCHADPVGFHGMALAIVVVPHITFERKDWVSSHCMICL
uniref:Uncharacterized protein n=1 Tax=Anabas testudineus TaxID=64144 RepID=A0A3Q1HP11_ANATE